MELPADGLLERADELAKLRYAISAAAAGTGRLLVIEGPAGIGMSALMRQARLEGAAAGMELLAARGLELERESTARPQLHPDPRAVLSPHGPAGAGGGASAKLMPLHR